MSGRAPNVRVEDVVRYLAAVTATGMRPSLDRAPRRRDFVLLRPGTYRITHHAPQSSADPTPPPRDPRLDRTVGAADFYRHTGSPGPPEAEIALESPEVLRLADVDRMHGSEHLLRFGWLFLVGRVDTEDGTSRVFLPLLTMPVRARRTGLGARCAIQLDADLRLDGTLVTGPVRRSLSDEAQGLAAHVLATGAFGHPLAPPVRKWVRRFAEAAGIPDPPVLPPDEDPFDQRDSEEVVVCSGTGVFLARNVDVRDADFSLLEWGQQPLALTAVQQVYLGAVGPPPEADESPPVTPMPLSRRQEEAVVRSRTAGITCVSGPPGTGKSHLAAAIAIDAVARGESVLVATRSEHAADVIEGLLGRYPTPHAVRFGKASRRRDVAAALSAGVERVPETQLAEIEESEAVARDDVAAIRAAIEVTLEVRRAFESAIAERHRGGTGPVAAQLDAAALGRADALAEVAASAPVWWRPGRSRRARRRLVALLGLAPSASDGELEVALARARREHAVRSGVATDSVDLARRLEDLERAQADWRRALGRSIEAQRQRSAVAVEGTRAVAALASALRAGAAVRRRMLRELETGDIQRVLPLWIGTLGEIDDFLPETVAGFDLVILDEASQIPQPAAIAALARAKRAVVLGDPHQLRHVSFLADEAQEAARARVSFPPQLAQLCDVRRNSLFDVAAASGIIWLDEHYRSFPHIIGFSAGRIYEDRLRIMTEHPGNETLDAIDVVSVAGERVDGINQAEVDAVEQIVRDALAEGEASVGVVTPFRAQADAIEEMLLARFRPSELQAASVRVGTVHGFQGDERDVVVISLALDTGENATVVRFVEDPNLFNVMVTRARRRIVVVTSLDIAEPGRGLLGDYLRHSHDPPWRKRSLSPPMRWAGDIAAAVEARGPRVLAPYPTAGTELDLVVGEGDAAVGVECRVHPHGPDAHIERHLALLRAGWTLVDCHEARFLAHPEAAADLIVDTMLRTTVRRARYDE